MKNNKLLVLLLLVGALLLFAYPVKAAVIFEHTATDGYWETDSNGHGYFCTYDQQCTAVLYSTHATVMMDFNGEHAFSTATGTVISSIRLSLAKEPGIGDPGRLSLWCDSPYSVNHAYSAQSLKKEDLDVSNFKIFQFDFPTSQCRQLRGIWFPDLGASSGGIKFEAANSDSQAAYGVGYIQYAGEVSGYGTPTSKENYEAYIQVADAGGFASTTPEVSKTPLLIVPGIMGTEIEKDGITLWPDVLRMLSVPGDNFMDPLSFTEWGQPLDVSLSLGIVMDKKPKFDYTQALIDDLNDRGYSLNQNLFTFPYDWRRDISEVASKDDPELKNPSLRQAIERVLATTGEAKVDIIAHSQGAWL